MPSSVEVSVKLALDKLRADAAKAAQELQQKFKDQTVKLNLDDGGFLGNLANHAKGFQDAVSEASQYTQALGQVSQHLDVAGDAINRFTSQASAASIAFDTAKAKVATLSKEAEAVAAAMDGVSDAVKNQANTTELLDASYDVLSSKTETLAKGLTDAQVSQEILTASTKGAVGGFSSVGVVADAVTSVLNAYGKSASEAGGFVDKFAATQNAGKITIDQYAQQIGKLAPIAALAGVNIDELNGFIATATVKGVSAESTFAGLRQGLSSVLKPTKEASDEAERLGISFGPAALKAKGLSGILGELNAKGLDTPEVLFKLFGSVEAVAAIAPSAGAGFKSLTQNIDASTNSAGVAQKAFDTVAGSFQGQLTAATNQASNSLVSLGNGVQKAMVPLLQALTFLVQNFNALPEPVKEATGVIIALTGGAIGLAAALAGFAATLPVIRAGLTELGIKGLLAGQGLTATGTGAAAGSVGLKSMAASAGTLVVKMALVSAAIAAVQVALSRFDDGGKSFNAGAAEIDKKLRDLQVEAGKTKKELESVLPKEPPPTDFVDGVVDKLNGLQQAFNKTVGLPDDLFVVDTNAEKRLEDLKVGVNEFQQATGRAIATSRSFSGSQAEAAKVQETLAAALDSAKSNLAALDPSKIGTKAYDELSGSLKKTVAELEKEQAALTKRTGAAAGSADATGKATAAVEDQTKALEKQKKAIAAVGDSFSEQSKVQEAGNKLRQTEIQTSVNEGLITEEEGRKQNLAAERQYLDQQLALNEAQLLKLKDLRASTTDPEALKELNSKITDLESEAQGKRLAIAQKAGEARKAAETEALDGVAKANEAANAKIEQSQNARVAAIKQAQVAGTVSAEEAAKQIAQIESDSSSQVLTQKQAELEQVKKLRAAGTLSAEEAAKRETALGAEISALNLSRLDKEIAAQKAAQEAAVQAVEDGLAKRTAALNLSDAEQLAAIRERQGVGIEAAKTADAAIAQIEQARSQKLVQLKSDELAKVKALVESGSLSAEDGAKREIAIETELANLRQQAAEAELARTEQIKQAKLDKLAAEREALQANAEIAQGQLGLETEAIASQNDLLGAKSNLLQAQSTLTEQRLKFAIEDAEAAGNSGKAEALKVRLAQEQIAAKEAQFGIEQQQLALKQQQIALELQSKQINAEIAAQEAAIAVQQAQANGDSAEKIAALQRIAGLRGQQLQAIGQQIASQSRLNALEQQALNTQQQATREAAKRALIVASRPPASAGSGTGRSNSSQATVTPATVTRSGGGGGAFSTRSSFVGQSAGAINNLLSNAVNPLDNGKLQTLMNSGGANSFQADQLRRSAELGTMSKGEVSGKLDQLIAATKDAVGRPNVSISNVDDAATIGKIYRESGRDSARRSGL